ncbi:MAG: PAS domain S-box protein [Thaumarchaeota archaeon]|nr:PAS domain S-box protein [Nitrososphaerota archaeon]
MSALQSNNNIHSPPQFNRLQQLENALDESSIVALTDKYGTITYVNEMFCKISKYSKEDLIGQNHRILKSGHHPPEFYQEMWNVISQGKVWRGEIKNKAKDGTYYWVKTVIVPFFDNKGSISEYVSIRTDITYHKKIEEQLRSSQEMIKHQLYEMKEIDLQKDAFVSMIAHELRTPLSPIMMHCEILKNPDIIGKLNPYQSEAVDDIYRNSDRLEKLVKNLLDVEKLDMNKMKFELEEFSVDGLMIDICMDFLTVMSLKRIKLINSVKGRMTIKSDKMKITQIFSNLIQNAADFVPQGTGRIEISAQRKEDNIVFCVQDNGPGIPEEKQNKIFKKFYQIDTSLRRKHEGTGLGLAVCKGMVEGIGGRIWVKSKENKGSSFFFSVPRQRE